MVPALTELMTVGEMGKKKKKKRVKNNYRTINAMKEKKILIGISRTKVTAYL